MTDRTEAMDNLIAQDADLIDAIERHLKKHMNDAVIFSDEQPLYAEQPSVSVTIIEKHIGEKNE